MSRPMTRIHNIQTNEIIDREMNDVEFTEYKKQLAKHEIEVAEAEAKAEAKAAAQSKLEALGLTVEDLQALGL